MMNLKKGDVICGFSVEKSGDIPKMNASYVKLTHLSTGATLYYSDRDDGQMIFSVGFRTIPENDTGVFHILEHSCLDGSESYPLKEPFVNLMKTSMATDLNAMTYPDKTIYYFVTTNEHDYMNMMSVYMDAVFHPLLLRDRRIFEKEAWHLEPDGEGGVACSGVVYNEMQGTENQPMNILYHAVMAQLFPDRYLRFNSGGAPAHIPELTYEAFCDTYRRFYSNRNAIFYLSGKLGLEEELSYIDQVLSARENTEGAVPPPPAALPVTPVVSPDGVAYYPLGDNEELENNTQLRLTFVAGDGRDAAELLALSFLCNYLAGTTEDPLSRAVLDGDVGQDFSMDCETDNLCPMVGFRLGKSDPEKAEAFRKVVLDTLSHLVAEGLDQKRLLGLMENHETECRRASLRVSTGFEIMESFLYKQVMFGDVVTSDGLEALRRNLDEDPLYFEHLIEKYILNSNHWALTRCIPSRTVLEERRATTEAWLKAEAEALRATPNGYETMEANAQALNEYLLAADDASAVASVPHLSPSDIGPCPEMRDMTQGEAVVGGATVPSLFYEAATNGMVEAGLLFDLSCIDPDDIFYAQCLADVLINLPTEGHTVNEMSDRRVELKTEVYAGVRVTANSPLAEDTRVHFSLTLDTPEEHLSEAVAYLGEYMDSVVFDSTILRRLFSNSTSFKNRLIRNGHATALRYGESSLTVAGAYLDRLSGVSAYRMSSRLADDFDVHGDELIAGLTRVAERIFKRSAPTCYLIGSADALATWHTALTGLAVKAQSLPACVAPSLTPRSHRALTIPGAVNYCAEGYCLSDVGETYSPRMQVITSYLGSTLFWDEIRAKGGAYGGFAMATHYGVLAFVSYRDPRLTDTYSVYDRLPDWMEAHLPAKEELDSLIVSTVGSRYFAARSPLDDGHNALMRYLRGRTAAETQADMAEIMGTTSEDFAAFARTVRSLKEKGCALRIALGDKEAVAASGLFDTAEEL